MWWLCSTKCLVLRSPLTIMPQWQDAKDAWLMFRHNLGLSQEHPRMGRYTFGEKFEYWAVIWGTVIMIITGFMLWNPIATTNFLPGQFVPASKAAHGGEAVLAILAILTWHFYNVHFKVFNRSIFTGYLSQKDMEEEHPLELVAIEKGENQGETNPAVIQKRKTDVYAGGYGHFGYFVSRFVFLCYI
jgi:cytochrome b subunit of formate dehydrogenase